MPKEIEPISYVRIGEIEHPIDAVTLNGETLPDDYICEICKHPASDFEPIYE
jgi:rubredoxin